MKQSEAKEQAEKLIGKTVKPKQRRGRLCLFVAGSNYTNIYGLSWDEAIARLEFLLDNNLPLNSELPKQLTKELKSNEVQIEPKQES